MADFSGHLHLRATRRDHGRTVLGAQSFRAPFHLSKPYWDPDAGVLHAQVVNPTAGILSGDRLESEIHVEAGAALMVTTPNASRLFQMRGGEAECRQSFRVAAGGWLEVLPEPLVPHRGSRYRQLTSIAIEPGGGLFFVDQLMPGRIAHGEAWVWDRLQLTLEVSIGTTLALRERFDHSGPELQQLAGLAGQGTEACFANAVLLTSDSAPEAVWRPRLQALHRDGLWLGVSALRIGGWSLRLVAPNALALRQAVRDVRQTLAPYFPRLACDARKV